MFLLFLFYLIYYYLFFIIAIYSSSLHVSSTSSIHTCTLDGHLHRLPYNRYRINPLNAELNPICYLLALLGAHHFLHVSRIRVKSLNLRLLMSYIYMEHQFLMFLDHTQRRSTVARTPLDE